jgi:cyclic beta-1,2-glucan synthetase
MGMPASRLQLARLDDATPHARLLSNSRYSVLFTGAGTGYSSWNGYALTSWNADRIEDADGLCIYLRDVESGALWSAGHHPVRKPPAAYDARYEHGRVSVGRSDDGIEARLELCVASDDDVEIRRVTLRNASPRVRRIELTSYAEIVLNYAGAHAAHPGFSKLFVQTEYVAEHGVLLARRRPRSRDEQPPWMMHALLGRGALQYETDRARFLGRGRTPAQPAAMTSSAPLSATAGSVLDPIFSLRRVVQLDAGENQQLTLLLGAGRTRASVLDLAQRYADPAVIARAFDGAAEQERALLRWLCATEDRGEYWQELAGAMFYGDPRLRAGPEILLRATGPWSPTVGPAVPATLQRNGLSGAGLLAIVYVERPEDRTSAVDLLQAHAYWRAKGFGVQLLLLCSDALADEVRRLTEHLPAGGAVVRRRSEIPPNELDLILASAQLVIPKDLPTLATSSPSASRGPRHPAGCRQDAGAPGEVPREALLFDNSYGGFAADGREYVVRLNPQLPPMPWINVIANETFGFLVSESGAGYTWSRNSRENRLTPWYNDPIADPHGEALYIRDEDAGVFWSPLPGPAPDNAPYEARHGFGYTRWRHSSQELEQEVWQFVPRHDPLKVTRLRLTNTSDHWRQVSIFAYYRLVLGVLPIDSGRFVVTEFDSESRALLARNRLNNEFGDAVVFVAAVTPEDTGPLHFTADRGAFIGRNGSPETPAAVCSASELDGKAGAGLDPCAALQIPLRVAPHSTVECAFLLGEAADEASVHTLLERYRAGGAISAALEEARDFWTRMLSAVEVETPSPAINLMLNGWLLYQTLSCRLWGRSAFYQSGGAFGFRDQLQDSAALIYARPDLTRAQILLHAGHQFVEGDVLHWWHAPADRGTRTRFSDDLLWLPYLTAFYVQTTGDWSVLDEAAGYVTARALRPGEDEAYLLAQPASETSDIYTHCCRALDRSLTRGAHGLPLMGTGDWNDGMNRVGREGRGESVWLGFFLYRILENFIPVCERRADHERLQCYRTYQVQLRAALNDAGWDGQWYRRAYYDDGTPLGSAQNEECRIDVLAQAWAVLSQAAPPERAAQAMDAVEHQLLSKEAGLIRLLTPPFDHDPHDPGYIEGYVPGIRENGGQYTHAAVWAVQALAELGRRDRAAAYLEMLTPVSHSRTPEHVGVYQVEPYVVAADIYGVDPHMGRGGWTWYTGSAGWMYRVAIESVLGFRLEGGNTLRLQPCVPDTWPEFAITYRLPDNRTRYAIRLRNPTGNAATITAVTVDGKSGMVENGSARIPLVCDGCLHRVDVLLAP